MEETVGFSKILVANRGEIARRVLRSARALGYRTVAVYSEADATAPHVAEADEAVLLGPAPASESYLAADKVLEAARRTGAGAVHPGYGFLSENADFARACADAGVTFIGPPPAAIELMGNKSAAKRAMEEAGVPCVPGYQGADQSESVFSAEAERIGYPVMVKAAAGGGGRGMRLVTSAGELAEALRSAGAEASSSFGSGELLLEKAIVEPRHVEIQVFCDGRGAAIHLGERDCSVQRRHQKVIEECPSPAVDEELRARMGEAAVEAARACGYVGAGTVEFLLDKDRRFYFLEMNTRLQVEHPVTEMVTGVDLVAWQIRVAAGEPLPVTQEEIRWEGHAVEARLYAEDPAQGFLPQTGRILEWRPAEGVDARVDDGVASGSTVSPHYDPMIAKVIAHGPDRGAARRKLVAALRGSTLFGLVTNKAFLAAICEHPVFAEGGATTGFLPEHFADHPTCRVEAPGRLGFATAAVLVFLEGARGLVEDESFIGWRSGGPIWTTVRLAAGGEERALQVTAEGRGDVGRRYRVREEAEAEETGDGGEPIELQVIRQSERELSFAVDGVQRRLRFTREGDELWIDDGRETRLYADVTHRPADASGAGTGRILAPLDGKVIDLRVEAGQSVEEGQLLVVVEAMKMEHRLLADVGGTVGAVQAAAGEQVKTGQLLVEIEPAEGES